jgi:hypothetical protein
LLRSIDGANTHTFFSYRVAETVGRFGRLGDNRLLTGWSAAERENLATACDSTSWLDLLDHGLPANYAAVLARCELARRTLGMPVDDAVLAQLLDRTRKLMARNAKGFLDDTEDGTGARYDIYSVDLYLFTEPFASELEPMWSPGLRDVLDLVAIVASRDGSALTWGRSLGMLAVCHTVELAALALQRDATDSPHQWLGLAANAIDHLDSWTDGMLVTAHHRRAQDHYRGPDRWLQLTFDCLGKLAWSAARFRQADVDPGTATLFGPRDHLVLFDDTRSAGVWTYRSPEAAFVVPFVGPAWADYLPAPRNPSLYEVPVDAPVPMGVPVIDRGAARYVGGGLPIAVTHQSRSISATYDRYPGVKPDHQPPLRGRRQVRFEVEHHVLHGREILDFDTAPDAISLQVAETRGRPLRFDVETTIPHRVDTVDTDGLAVYRSFWSELPRIHQVDIEPRAHVEFDWSVRPLLRVGTPDPTHHYHRSLYDQLSAEVCERSFGGHLVWRRADALRKLHEIDVFHLHWPEWFVETPEHADKFLQLLAETETTLVWTQHNLRPHRDLERAEELYQRFASAADVAVHHSEWGRRVVQDRYAFRADAIHIVSPHGHFGALVESSNDPHDRASVEQELGLSPCELRIAIVGAPRREKHVEAFMSAFARCQRDDVQLLVLSLDGEAVPDDPRITALPYEFVDRDTYNRRLTVADVIALPFDPEGEMLTTGVVGDVVGAGLPAIASSWAYLAEALGEAAIVYESMDGLVDLLDSLSTAQLDEARDASIRLRSDLDWEVMARQLFDVLLTSGALKL